MPYFCIYWLRRYGQISVATFDRRNTNSKHTSLRETYVYDMIQYGLYLSVAQFGQ